MSKPKRHAQARQFASLLGEQVLDQEKIEMTEDGSVKEYTGRTLAVFFPDTGSSVWAEQDWKVGKKDAKVPPCVRFAAFPRSRAEKDDSVGIDITILLLVIMIIYVTRRACNLGIHRRTHTLCMFVYM